MGDRTPLATAASAQAVGRGHSDGAPRKIRDAPSSRLNCEAACEGGRAACKPSWKRPAYRDFRIPNTAPCGSLRMAKRPPGKSTGETISLAPIERAVLKEASTSATEK